MQFLLIAYDSTDAEAPKRRMAAREAHLALIAEIKKAGNVLYGGAILDDTGKMKGSAIVYDFPSREDFDKYLATDPYVTEKVWGEMSVQPYQTAPSFI